MPTKIDNLPLLKYYGKHKDVSEFYYGFLKRLTANDYDGQFECFYYEAIALEHLESTFQQDVNFSIFAQNAREKLTQLIFCSKEAQEKITTVESEINKLDDNKINFSDNYFNLINIIELVILKLSAVLDILAKISSYFYSLKGVPNVADKYGRQRAYDFENEKFYNPFDETYQKILMNKQTINLFHDYRNKFSHEKSLKLLPITIGVENSLVITEGNSRGIIIMEGISLMMDELREYIKKYEQYFTDLFK